jgi:quercetin 2,3-dioxygenase
MDIVYLIGGTGRFDQNKSEELLNLTMAQYGDEGNRVDIHAGDNGVRFLFFSGKPLREPIVWGGPIVMNAQEELKQAFNEYENDTFIQKNRYIGIQ